MDRSGRDVAEMWPYGAIRSHTAPVSKLPLDGMHQWQWYRHGNPVGDSPGGGLVSDALRTDQSPSEFIRVQKVICCQCISNHIKSYQCISEYLILEISATHLDPWSE